MELEGMATYHDGRRFNGSIVLTLQEINETKRASDNSIKFSSSNPGESGDFYICGAIKVTDFVSHRVQA